MTLTFNNQDFDLENFTFIISKSEENVQNLLHRIDCSFLDDSDINMSELAQMAINDFDGNITITTSKTTYSFSGFEFENVNLYADTVQENIGISFSKEVVNDNESN